VLDCFTRLPAVPLGGPGGAASLGTCSSPGSTHPIARLPFLSVQGVSFARSEVLDSSLCCWAGSFLLREGLRRGGGFAVAGGGGAGCGGAGCGGAGCGVAGCGVAGCVVETGAIAFAVPVAWVVVPWALLSPLPVPAAGASDCNALLAAAVFFDEGVFDVSFLALEDGPAGTSLLDALTTLRSPLLFIGGLPWALLLGVGVERPYFRGVPLGRTVGLRLVAFVACFWGGGAAS
jgi:hypothetical protein